MVKKTVKNVLFLLTVSLVFFACSTSKKTSGGDSVPYQLARNYFVNNTYNQSGVVKVVNQNDFNAIFGMATVMGEKGKPTPIDFNKNFVIAIIGETSNKQPSITVNSLVDEGNKVLLNYSVNNKAETSYSLRPSAILIVDKAYDKKIESTKQ